MDGSFNLTEELPVTNTTYTLTIMGDTDDIVLTRGVNATLFKISSGASLALDNIVLDGNQENYASNTGSLVLVSGSLSMCNGAVLRNNRAANGGGVFVNGGAFILEGGEISGNSANSGGGVLVDSGAFTMESGTISGNSANAGGEVFVDESDQFTMSGGLIFGTGINETAAVSPSDFLPDGTGIIIRWSGQNSSYGHSQHRGFNRLPRPSGRLCGDTI